MCVSRFSIPPDARREDVALDGQLALEAADEGRGLRGDGNELRHRPTVLRDDDPLGADPVEQGEALGLELGGRALPWSRGGVRGRRIAYNPFTLLPLIRQLLPEMLPES
jgi:hypothetical protein